MPSIQKKGQSYYCQFTYHGKRHTFTLGEVSAQEANAKASQVNYLLIRLKQGTLTLPAGIDIVHFMQQDGNPTKVAPTLPEAPRKGVTLIHLRDRWIETYANGTIEASSLKTCRIHFNHFCNFLGEAFPLNELKHSVLQDYVNKRSAKVGTTTIRKEIATLRGAWNWGLLNQLTEGNFPNRGLRYPKSVDKPVFMTFDEATRQIAAGGNAELIWDAVYLKTDEIAELLEHVKAKAACPWVYPLFCFAAHTGARRSEMIRVRVADVDFTANIVTLKEKKKNPGKETNRRVPLTRFLREVLEDWLKEHPGGQHLFAHSAQVARSTKRSQTTGHLSGKARPSGQKARMKTVRARGVVAPSALTKDEIHHHFKQVLKGSKWENLKGPHALRHSFVSACASKGVDQRLVETWAGHMSQEMSRRYAHLWPSKQQEAISGVFE
jgi:integrase